jgi:hypothetical protein
MRCIKSSGTNGRCEDMGGFLLLMRWYVLLFGRRCRAERHLSGWIWGWEDWYGLESNLVIDPLEYARCSGQGACPHSAELPSLRSHSTITLLYLYPPILILTLSYAVNSTGFTKP